MAEPVTVILAASKAAAIIRILTNKANRDPRFLESVTERIKR